MEQSIECGFCLRKFSAGETPESACSACPASSGSCGKAKCPHCGYDNPLPFVAPRWLANLLAFLNPFSRKTQKQN